MKKKNNDAPSPVHRLVGQRYFIRSDEYDDEGWYEFRVIARNNLVGPDCEENGDYGDEIRIGIYEMEEEKIPKVIYEDISISGAIALMNAIKKVLDRLPADQVPNSLLDRLPSNSCSSGEPSNSAQIT